jgi:hypothetical protein
MALWQCAIEEMRTSRDKPDDQGKNQDDESHGDVAQGSTTATLVGSTLRLRAREKRRQERATGAGEGRALAGDVHGRDVIVVEGEGLVDTEPTMALALLDTLNLSLAAVLDSDTLLVGPTIPDPLGRQHAVDKPVPCLRFCQTAQRERVRQAHRDELLKRELTGEECAEQTAAVSNKPDDEECGGESTGCGVTQPKLSRV